MTTGLWIYPVVVTVAFSVCVIVPFLLIKWFLSGAPPQSNNRTATRSPQPTPHWFYLAVAIFLVLMTIMAIAFRFQGKLLNGPGLNSDSLKYSLPSYVFVMAVLAWTIKDKMWFRQGMVGFGLVLLFFFPLTGQAVESILNESLDFGPEWAHIEPTIDKYISVTHGRFRQVGYYIIVHSWHSDHTVESVQVGKSFYERVVPKHTSLLIKSKPGCFHFEWVTSCQIAQ